MNVLPAEIKSGELRPEEGKLLDKLKADRDRSHAAEVEHVADVDELASIDPSAVGQLSQCKTAKTGQQSAVARFFMARGILRVVGGFGPIVSCFMVLKFSLFKDGAFRGLRDDAIKTMERKRVALSRMKTELESGCDELRMAGMCMRLRVACAESGTIYDLIGYIANNELGLTASDKKIIIRWLKCFGEPKDLQNTPTRANFDCGCKLGNGSADISGLYRQFKLPYSRAIGFTIQTYDQSLSASGRKALMALSSLMPNGVTTFLPYDNGHVTVLNYIDHKNVPEDLSRTFTGRGDRVWHIPGMGIATGDVESHIPAIGGHVVRQSA